MLQFNYSYLINHLKINTARRTYFFDIFVTPQVLSLLFILQELNVIRRFSRITQSKYRIFPSWSAKNPAYTRIKMFSRSTNPITIRWKALTILQHNTGNSSLILSTPKGLITHQEAIRQKTGGHLICLIF